MSQEFATCADAASVTSVALKQSMQVMRARLGIVQLADWAQEEPLEIVEQCGFSAEYIDRFRRLSLFDSSACARALRSRSTVVVDDVLVDPEFAPYRDILQRSGVRSVQSTPMVSMGGAVVGVVSTHDPQPKRPSERQLESVWGIARGAAEAILRLRVLKRIAGPAQPPAVATLPQR